MASAATIEVTGIDTYNANGNVDLKAIGNLTVDPGAIIQTGTGTISLAARRQRGRHGQRRLGHALD